MSESDPPASDDGNRRVTQVMALAAAIAGGVVAYAYSVAAAIILWVLAGVLLIGSFFIERDF